MKCVYTDFIGSYRGIYTPIEKKKKLKFMTLLYKISINPPPPPAAKTDLVTKLLKLEIKILIIINNTVDDAIIGLFKFRIVNIEE